MTDPTFWDSSVLRDLIAGALVIFTVVYNGHKTRGTVRAEGAAQAVKVAEIHVLVNSRLHEALQEIEDLKAQLNLPLVPPPPSE